MRIKTIDLQKKPPLQIKSEAPRFMVVWRDGEKTFTSPEALGRFVSRGALSYGLAFSVTLANPDTARDYI